MAYYGIRSVLILYAISQFEMPRELALSHYGTFTWLVYIAVIIGGFFGDLILGARNGILVGLGLCIAGSIAVLVPETTICYFGLLLISLGTGFTRPNTFSIIGHGTAIKNTARLEKRFISMYAAVNIGAFFAAITIGYIGETFGFIYSFISVAVLYGLSFGLTFIISPKRTSTIINNLEPNKSPRPVGKSLLIVILTIITSAAFWMIFELYSMDYSFFRMNFLRSEVLGSALSDLTWALATVILMFFAIPYYFVARSFSLYLKVGIGMALIGLCWLVTILLESHFLTFGFGLLMVMAFIEALGELFVGPAVLTILSKHTTKRYYGIVFAAFSSVSFIGMRLLLNSGFSLLEYVVHVGLILVIITSIVLYSVLAFTEKEEPNLSDLDE